MEIVEESGQNKKAWNELVKSLNGSVFHLWEWSDFISKTYGYRKLFLASFDKHEEKFEFGIPFLVTNSALKKRVISLPFTDYAGMIGKKNEQVQLELKEIAKKNKMNLEIFELDTRGSFIANSPEICTFNLNCEEDFEKIWTEKYDKKVRNMVRKAEKKGVEVKVVEADSKNISNFYSLYIKTMKRLNAIAQGKKYFENLFSTFENSKIGVKTELRFAYCQNKTIGTSITLKYGDKVHIYANSSDEAFLDYAPNNAIYNSIIQDAAKDKLNVDFGSTLKGSNHYFFKKEWGGKEISIRQIIVDYDAGYLLGSEKIDSGERTNNRAAIKKISALVPTNLYGSFGSFLFRYFY